MSDKIVRIVPEDRRPETIANVVCVMRIVGGNFSGAHTDVLRLEGTVEEKLQQYRDWAGKEWNGFGEQRFTEFKKKKESGGLNLGKKKEYEPPYGIRISREAQDKIDALVEEARETLRWNEEMKETWPERKKLLKRRSVTENDLVEAVSVENDENSYF